MHTLRLAHRTMGGLVLISTLVLGPAPSSAQLGDTPWPMLQHDVRRTGQSAFLGPLFPVGSPAPTDVTSWQSFGAITSTPTLASDGTIYVQVNVPRAGTSPAGYLCAINPDMTQKWCVRTRASASQSAAAVASDGTVYIGDRNNTVTRFDPATGNKLCEYYHGFEGDSRSSPAIGADGTIYVAFSGNLDGIGVVTALNPDCSLRWNHAVGNFIGTSSPALLQLGSPPGPLQTFLYIGDMSGRLHKLQDNGTFATRLWKAQLGTKITASPVIGADGTIYIGSTNGLSAVRPSDGAILWNIPTGAVEATAALGTDGTVYFGARSGTARVIYAVASDGALRWQYGPVTVASPHGGFPALGADGVVYVGFGTGIRAFLPDGVSLWTYDTGKVVSSFPTIAGTASTQTGATATLYVVAGDSTLYAISSPRHGGDSNDPPTANAGPDQAAVVGQVVQFNASASDANGDALSYSWDFGDGTSALGPTAHHAYDMDGQYVATLTVTDGLASSSDALTVTVTSSPGPTAFSDDFNGPDSPNLLNQWQEAQGDLVIISDEARNAALTGTHIAIQPALSGLTHAAAASFATVDNKGGPRLGVVLRFHDPQNYYLFYRQVGGSSVLRISRIVNGSETVLASTGIPNPTVNMRFRLTADAVGNTLTLKLCAATDTSTGTTCASVAKTLITTDSTLSGGSVGFLLRTGVGSTAQHRVDNFAALVQ